MVTVRAGDNEYTWEEHWAQVPDPLLGKDNARTHGVAVTRHGEIIIFRQASPAVLFFDPDGKFLRGWGDRFLGAHGLTLVEEGGEERLWLTDESTGEVVKTDLLGNRLLNLERPDLTVYNEKNYSPTWVAVNEERFGGDGSVWVADGYGSSYVHQYDRDGKYIGSLTGEEGAGRFMCPHGIWTDRRGPEPRLYVADRRNLRMQVYRMNGTFEQTFGEDFMVFPDGCCTDGTRLIVPELYGRVTVLDENNQLIGYLGRNEEAMEIEGWPDLPADKLQPGRFNSPHAAAADGQGNLYIVEWILGGRIIRLKRTGAPA